MLFSQQAQGREAIIAGFFHEGYEEPLLMLMRRRGVHSGLVVKVNLKLYIAFDLILYMCFVF